MGLTRIKKGLWGLACFRNLHMIAGWHEQIRWPRDLATQMIKYGGGSFGDAVIARASWRHTGESGTEPITAITQAPRHQAISLQRI